MGLKWKLRLFYIGLKGKLYRTVMKLFPKPRRCAECGKIVLQARRDYDHDKYLMKENNCIIRIYCKECGKKVIN